MVAASAGRDGVAMTVAGLGWLLLTVLGLWVALVASRRVATHATIVATSTRMSPFLLGLVVLAVGTDVPEIVNSIITSAAGHGDLNVGDSMGSALTQMTLVLGLLPFLAGVMPIERRAVVVIGALTSAALVGSVFLGGDGDLSRRDGLILLGLWGGSMFVAARTDAWPDVAVERAATEHRWRHLALVVGSLLAVAAGAGVAVKGTVELARILDAPEFLISFFGAALGTSMPELIVDVTALRRGAYGLAVGDVLGSSLVDATLSIGIGPALFPTDIDAGHLVRGGLYAAAAVALVALTVGSRDRHDRRSGLMLLVIYGAAYAVMLR